MGMAAAGGRRSGSHSPAGGRDAAGRRGGSGPGVGVTHRAGGCGCWAAAAGGWALAEPLLWAAPARRQGDSCSPGYTGRCHGQRAATTCRRRRPWGRGGVLNPPPGLNGIICHDITGVAVLPPAVSRGKGRLCWLFFISMVG